MVLLGVYLVLQYRGLYGNFLFDDSHRLVGTDLPIHFDFAARVDRAENTNSSSLKWPFKPEEPVRIFLIHVGKAGGMSLYQKLGIRNEKQLQRKLTCHRQRKIKCEDSTGPSKFGQSLLARFHMMARSLSTEQQDYLLHRGGSNLLVFTVRRPLDRIVSAFYYHKATDGHKDKQVGVFDCFSTIHDLAQSLQQGEEGLLNNQYCANLAVELIQGNLTARSQLHFHYNYQYYAEKIWTNRAQQNVAVIRTEHQWSDMARIEKHLGGDPAFFLSDQVHYSHGSENFAQDGLMNQSDRRAICCILKDELQVYTDLILASINLNSAEKEASLQSAQESCGVSSEFFFLHGHTTATDLWQSWYQKSCVATT